MNMEAKSPTDMMSEDLAKSGLVFEDMLTRILDESTREAIGVTNQGKGYVIPYFDLYGKLSPFYRVRMFGAPSGAKYLQPKGTSNHVYFPKNFMKVFKGLDYKLCVLTEGEKKAALCNRMGFPAVAFGGVDSWINKSLRIPVSSEITSTKKATNIKLPSANFEEVIGTLAIGLQELLDLGMQHKTTFIIIYDRDTPHGTSAGPQRAAARLGHELRFKGFHVAQIRQLVPPAKYSLPGENGRATIEDILLHSEGGVDALSRLISENLAQRTSFPPHPSIREHIAKQLQKPRLDRKSYQSTSLSIITWLDIHGTRMWSPDDMQMYYFFTKNNHLMKVNINQAQVVKSQESEFGQLLYQEFGLSMSADQKMIQWLGTQFASEDPLEYVTPHRIIARPKPDEDVVRFQINNGQYVKVTGDIKEAFRVLPNGAENVLFESQYDPIINPGIKAEELEAELKKQFSKPVSCWWYNVLSEVKLKYPGKQAILMSYLYYMSPFLNRWRGTQLPIEIVTGEAGSGKSTLFEVRLNVLTGDPILRNSPMSIKDWYASLASGGGMQIIDNVGKADKQMRETMSDELCRLVTEPNPRIQMRKYFTEADERTISINTVFGFTAIQPPFQNSDLLQRSITLELDKSQVGSNLNENSHEGLIFDSHWKEKQLTKYGGRAAWVAHHMIVLHKFFALVEKKWNKNYLAKNRLINIEQIMILMAEVFGQDGSWIPDYMNDTTTSAISSSDWTMEGLIEFATVARAKEIMLNKKRLNKDEELTYKFTAGTISDWAGGHEDFEKNYILTNSRSLGRYMSQHRYNLQHIAGIIEWGHKNNKQTYRAIDIPKKEGRDVAPPDDPRRSRRGLDPIQPKLTPDNLR